MLSYSIFETIFWGLLLILFENYNGYCGNNKNKIYGTDKIIKYKKYENNYFLLYYL